jgi:diacylglycerol kinase (ATP)
MQAHLIYNGQAGRPGSGPDADALQHALKEAGFEPIYTATSKEGDVDDVLADAEGVVVAAGGDGTVRATLTRLIGRDLPLAIVPMGTANNIAKSLEAMAEPIESIAGLRDPREVPFDVGRVQAPWGTDYFVEGAGFGFFADVLATYQPEKGKSIWRGMEATSDILLEGRAYSNCLRFNGTEFEGKFLLVELLNTAAVGPRLQFAPEASSADGLLELVCIEEDDREGFLQYAANMVRDKLDELQSVTKRQIRELHFSWDGYPLHVDGFIRPDDWHERAETEETEWGPHAFLPDVEPAPITVEVLPGAVTLWLPTLDQEEQ